MKKLLCAVISAAMLAGCSAPAIQTTQPAQSVTDDTTAVRWTLEKGGLEIQVPEGMAENAITAANDIIYYEAGHGGDYGEGENWEAHTAEEAARHTVVHINAPGTYVLSGKLEAGQIAVDLGEEASEDPNAVVTLVLDGLDITCTVAPAIIFYNVYESGEPEGPAGANVILAEGSQNYVNGSHVAKIYKPGTEKKLHKYDAAFYSRMSMNVGGEGCLEIQGDNEGLDSEMHLTIDSGEICIRSGNDGINANADGESVVTVNGGMLSITVTGETGEGDGIDSNGWLYIKGGTVEAFACGSSMDSGVDADMGIIISGGNVLATGNMLDTIDSGSQTYAVFNFAQTQTGGSYALKNEKGTPVFDITAPNAFTSLLYSAPALLVEGNYTLWSGQTQFEGMTGYGGGFAGFIGGGQPIDRPDWPDRPGKGDGDVEIPPQPTNPVVTHGGTVQIPQGEQPENMPVPDFSGDFDPSQMPVPPMPQGGEQMPMPGMPNGVEPNGGGQGFVVMPVTGALSTEFPITRGANYFSMVRPVE